jgi:hypothetical protein
VTQSTYAIVVFMTAITTLLAPPVLRHIFRPERLSALQERIREEVEESPVL